MNLTESKMRRSKSNQAAGESTALDPDAASVVGADGAPDSTVVACGALRASALGAGFPTIKSCYFGAVVLLVEMLWIKFVHLEELLMS
uniref:Uncharacterized protein n=1 Tax=Oryza rufipogon TaxID=4529 RepID=A0A0E0R6D0_ORYRU